MAHLKTGKILIFDTNDEQLWTPPAGPFVSVRNLEEANLACAGHSALADGRLLVVGGEMVQGTAPDHAYLFDPDYVPPASPWSLTDPMAYRRWYPTCTTLPDGKMLVTNGHVSHGPPHVVTTIPELFDPDAAPGQKWESVLDAELEQNVYPHMFVLPDGNPVDVKLRARSQRLMTETEPWEWVEIPTSNPPWSNLWAVTQIMYEPGKVLRCGGATGTEEAAVQATALIDFNQDPPEWKTVPSMDMFFARRNHHLVMLPDGKVLVVGGTVTMAQGDPDAVLEAEIFDPASKTWERTDVEMTDPRWAHATAILLRDATVLTAGGELAGTYVAHTAQIFRPPYLDGDPPRAAYTTDPPLSVMIYGQGYTFGYTHPTGLGISKVCLIRLAAITHRFDQDQRYLTLSFTDSDGSIALTAPTDGNLAPPGYYMLFIVDENGVPCASAAYVRVAAA